MVKNTWPFSLNKERNSFSSQGFTLPELVVTIFVLLTLVSLITINLSYTQRRATLNTAITTLVADLKDQQMKAMSGDTEGRSSADNYGIYFQSGSYVLFHGSSYNASASANTTITIDTSQHFTTTGKTVLFNRVTGEVSGYNSSSDTITLEDIPSGDQKTLEYNRYGVITGVN